MFIVELGSAITTVIFLAELFRGHYDQLWFVGVITVWLWLTVLFANFAEAIAEGRGKAQANALRATRTTTTALRRSHDGHLEAVAAPDLQKGDVIAVEAGMVIAADGELMEGAGSVDEQAFPGAQGNLCRAEWRAARLPAWLYRLAAHPAADRRRQAGRETGLPMSAEQLEDPGARRQVEERASLFRLVSQLSRDQQRVVMR